MCGECLRIKYNERNFVDIVKRLNGAGSQLSYGDKTLSANIGEVEEAIRKVQYTERIWDRSRSQYTLKHLTCSNADDWLRLRQVGAEMSKKRQAYSEGKLIYLEYLTKAKIEREKIASENNVLQKELLEIEATRFDLQACEVLIKIEGAMKEITLLATMHDDLVSNLGEITEDKFEEAQVKSHLKRAVVQSVRDMRECGAIRCGNQEYLEQIGVCVTSARKDIEDFLNQEEQSKITNTSLLHAFVNAFADKYAEVSGQQARHLGFSDETDKSLTYTPKGEDDAILFY